MEELGGYAFTADIEQTLIPRPIPANIGQTEQRTDVRLDGEVTSPDQVEIHMRLEGARPDAPPLTIIQEGNDYFLLKEGERTPIENPYGTAVPNGDFLSYLNAADNIQPITNSCPPDFACYTFDLNGRRFAEHIREQMQALDSSRTFGPSPMLQRLTGTGQLWINAAGLPQRQELTFHIPQLDDAYDADIHLIVDFTHPEEVGTETGDWKLETDNPIFNLQSSISNSSFTIHNSLFIIPPLPYLAASLIIFLLFIRRRTRRLAYNIVAISMTLVMLTAPLLQPASLAHAQTRQLQSRSTLVDALGLPSDQSSVSSDQLPVESDRIFTLATRTFANSQTSAACGSGDPHTDTDNDGFNDRDENCYGTDPFVIDSDMDLITNTTEIEGFWFNGRTWPSDPISLDSNNDGLSDMVEWPYPIGEAPNDDEAISDADWDPDGDGTPNLWDDDNDGDGVYDSGDISPYYHSNFQDSFTLTVDWGDGITNTFSYPDGTTVFSESHVYADDDSRGTPADDYPVSLTMEDSGGYSDEGYVSVTVQNAPPDVTANADPMIVKPVTAVSFTGSFTDAGLADTHTILWEFGDGDTADTLTTTHTYTNTGVFTPTLTITDDDGGIGQDQVLIRVESFAIYLPLIIRFDNDQSAHFPQIRTGHRAR